MACPLPASPTNRPIADLVARTNRRHRSTPARLWRRLRRQHASAGQAGGGQRRQRHLRPARRESRAGAFRLLRAHRQSRAHRRRDRIRGDARGRPLPGRDARPLRGIERAARRALSRYQAMQLRCGCAVAAVRRTARVRLPLRPGGDRRPRLRAAPVGDAPGGRAAGSHPRRGRARGAGRGNPRLGA